MKNNSKYNWNMIFFLTIIPLIGIFGTSIYVYHNGIVWQEINELTQSVFVRVEEYTETDDLEESYQIWDNLLSQLKEIIGA